MDYDTFYAVIYKQGGSLVVTVPSNLLKFGGYAEGDEVKIMIKKKVV
jgi:antitoxin component of MazEF toxin-antitoxin module